MVDLAARVRALSLKVVPPLSEAEVVAIELRGLSLPADYRGFVTRVASEIDDTKLVHPRKATAHLFDPESAFPSLKGRTASLRMRSFGFSLDDANRAMHAAAKHLKDGLAPGPARPEVSFAFADSTLGRMVFADEYPIEEVWLQGNDHGEGVLVLEEQGCGWQINLVVDGPLRGTVWHSGEYGWLPHFYVDANGNLHAHDFTSWIAVQLGMLGV